MIAHIPNIMPLLIQTLEDSTVSQRWIDLTLSFPEPYNNFMLSARHL